MPDYSDKYHIKIKIGEYELETANPKEHKNGYNRWSERFNQTIMRTHYTSLGEMQNVFVFLMYGKIPLCYWKGKVSDFTDPNPKYQWVALKADNAIGKIEN